MKKKKNNKPEEQMENYFDVFMRNYRNVPGFRSLVKLLLYFLFIFVFVIVVLLANGDIDTENKDDITSITTASSIKNKTYKDILESIANTDKNYKMEITINSENYLIEASNISNEVLGYFETNENTKRFKISNSKIYELKLDNSIENENLFGEIEIDFIVPANLINILKNNLSTKRISDNETVYTYEIEYKGIDYKINTYVVGENLTKIDITNNEYSYIINYEQEDYENISK